MKNNRRASSWFILILTVSLLLLYTVVLYATEIKYTCPMHPHYISDTFGTCPICGMDLVEVETEDNAGHEDEHGLKLPEYMIQRTGVRTSFVETAYFGRSIRSFGEVVVNRRLQSDIALRVEGWIEELVVSAEGDEVEPGSLLFRFYSPQLVSAEQDYLGALASGNRERIDATQDRLFSLGLGEKVIKQIRDNGEPIRALPFYAGQAGQVENIMVRQGSYLKPGSVALSIQGYTKVWVQVDLAEQDISFVTKDSRVDVSFPNLGISHQNVAIDYVSPKVDPATRTAQLRLIMDNPEGIIRPGAYADVMIMTDISPRLAVPYESVLKNKDGSYVIIQKENGLFQAREIETGLKYRGFVEVKAGLAAGEKVVTSGQFLIDSESSLRESFQRMEKLSLSLTDLGVSKDQLALLNHMVEGTMYLHEQLTAGSFPEPQVLDAAEQAARKLKHQIQGTRLIYIVDDFLAALKDREKVMTVSGWQDVLANGVEALSEWVVEARPAYYRELGLAFFRGGDGRNWIQFDGEMLNPYGRTDGVKVNLDLMSGMAPEEHKHE